MKRFRFRPTYSNVVASLALFFALAGGAWAATQLPKGSVGSAQLKNGAVTPGKLSAQAKQGFTGPRGEAGAQGALGPRGNEGPRGENGVGGATGPQGLRGATGATGATGSRGEPGEVGVRGPQGEPGPTGPRGETGAQGQVGPQGPQGDTGAQGPQGDAGPQGAQGDTGPQGDTGLQGPQGDPGPQGKQGEPGPSDAYYDISGPDNEVTHKPATPNVPLEVKNLPEGQYVLQAVLTVRGNGGAALAECEFGSEGTGITLGPSVPFLVSTAANGYAALAGTTTAVITEPSTVNVTCETAEADTNFVIPAESGRLTATRVGTLHVTTQ